MVHEKPIEIRFRTRFCVKIMTVAFFAKPFSYNLPWANTLGMACIFNFRDVERKIDRNMTSRATLHKIYVCVEGRRLFSPRRGTDFRARNGGGCAAIGAGFTAALPAATPRATAASAIGVERATAATLVLEGWWLPLPWRLAVSRASDATDASDSASHPLFQRDAPPLASSQRPALVASQRNAPLQQSQRERVAPQPLVTSQREGVAPLQQPLVPPQQLRPVSHQDVPPLNSSSRRDA
ncbi:hypothetical protein BHM03_00062253, partial [Ensete ventricosum]